MSDRDRSPVGRRLADLRGASLAFALEALIVVVLVCMAIALAALALAVF